MKTKIIRVQQDLFNQDEVEIIINATTKKLIGAGSKIVDIKFSIGRDTESPDITKKFTITFLILYQ